MTTPSDHPGSGNDPYGSAGQYPTGGGAGYTPPGGPGYPPAGQPGYQQPGQYPPPVQYPPSGQYPPPDQYAQYPAQQYGAPNPYGQPGYGAKAGTRPGMVTAAAVLAFVVGGLAILLGLVFVFLGSAATSYFGSIGGLVFLVAIIILAIGALYIWAGVQALTGKNAKILTVVAIVAVVLQLFGLISNFEASSLVALAIQGAIIALLLQPQSKEWFRSRGASTF